MADSKEQIKKDLTAIMKLDSQIDYSQKAAVEKYHKLLVQKNLLTTAVGKRYLKKLEQIINGEADYNKCLFCTKETQHNTVICPSCMAKSKQSATVSATVYCRNCGRKISASDTTCSVCGTATGEGYKYCAHCGNKVPMPNIEYLANDVKNKSMDFAGQAAKIAKENVQNIAKQGEKLVGDITEDAKRVKKAKTDNPKEKKGPNKKGIILLIILILIAIGIVDTIGLGTIFEFFAMIALGSLIYKAVKKQPKKKAAIVFVILCVLSGLTGMNSTNGIDDNVLDYLGTKESIVYQTYDKDGFEAELNFLTNENTNKSGLPHISLDGNNPRKVYAITLASGMAASFHANGLQIGDNVSQIKKWVKKSNAAVDKGFTTFIDDNKGILTYHLRYKGKDIQIILSLTDGVITRIDASLSE